MLPVTGLRDESQSERQGTTWIWKKTAYLVATEMGVVIAIKRLCHLVVCADSYRLIQ